MFARAAFQWVHLRSAGTSLGSGRSNTRYFDFGKKYFSHNSFLRQELNQHASFAPFNTPQSQKRNASVMYEYRFSPLQRYDLTFSRYYTASLIVGTVALAYGSVPLYKMVRGSLSNGLPVSAQD